MKNSPVLVPRLEAASTSCCSSSPAAPAPSSGFRKAFRAVAAAAALLCPLLATSPASALINGMTIDPTTNIRIASMTIIPTTQISTSVAAVFFSSGAAVVQSTSTVGTFAPLRLLTANGRDTIFRAQQNQRVGIATNTVSATFVVGDGAEAGVDTLRAAAGMVQLNSGAASPPARSLQVTGGGDFSTGLGVGAAYTGTRVLEVTGTMSASGVSTFTATGNSTFSLGTSSGISIGGGGLRFSDGSYQYTGVPAADCTTDCTFNSVTAGTVTANALYVKNASTFGSSATFKNNLTVSSGTLGVSGLATISTTNASGATNLLTVNLAVNASANVETFGGLFDVSGGGVNQVQTGLMGRGAGTVLAIGTAGIGTINAAGRSLYGVYGLGSSSNNGDTTSDDMGGYFASLPNAATRRSVGAMGVAKYGSTTANYGGYFSLTGTGTTATTPNGAPPATPNPGSAALAADNSDQAAPIFLALDNGTTQFIIADGGKIGAGTSSPLAKLSVVGDSSFSSFSTFKDSMTVTERLAVSTSNASAALTLMTLSAGINASNNNENIGALFDISGGGVNQMQTGLLGRGAGTTLAIGTAGIGTINAGGRSLYGVYGLGSSSNSGNTSSDDMGGYFTSLPNATTRRSVGAMGIAKFGSTTANYGGYFGLTGSGTTATTPNGAPPATPNPGSAALAADNRDQAAPILLGLDNGTTVFQILDGGNMEVLRGTFVVTSTGAYVTGLLGQTFLRSCATGAQLDASGVFSACVASDISLKTAIETLKYDPAAIDSLRPVSYRWKPGMRRDSAKHIGFIAQEVEKISPEAILPAGTNLKGIDPAAVLALVVRELQEERKLRAAFEARINALEKKK